MESLDAIFARAAERHGSEELVERRLSKPKSKGDTAE